jgi:hypothetical protein
MPAHDGHATIEAGAAIVLSVGGAAILLRAWLDRRSSSAVSRSRPRSPAAAIRMTARYLAAIMSGSAALIHLAAGPEHVEALGDVGLLFYWAALFQGGLAVALLTRRLSPGLVRIGIVGNALLVGAWAWSRTTGLPIVPGGPEAVGLADGVTIALEIAIIAILVGWSERVDLWLPAWASPSDIRTVATSSLVALVGAVVLATTIAVVDAGGGHHDTGSGHHAASVHAP